MGEILFTPYLSPILVQTFYFFFLPKAGLQLKIKSQNSVNSFIFHIPGFTFIIF